jgi:hypothetical protein
MARRIGFIQTRGIGDIIIALPIADAFIEQGCEVYWPIDAAFVSAFAAAKPEVRFLPVAGGSRPGLLPQHPGVAAQGPKNRPNLLPLQAFGGRARG